MADLAVFTATMAHQRPPRLLYYAKFSQDLQRRLVAHTGRADVEEYFGFFRPVVLAPKRPPDIAPPDYSSYWADRPLPTGTTFNSDGVAMVPSGFYHFWGYVSPLSEAESLSEIEQYPLDDLSRFDYSHMADIVAGAHAAGGVVMGSIGHIYERAWQIRGYEQFLVDLLERPAWAECLLERICCQNIIKAEAYARVGADYLFCGDDVANQNNLMFAPKIWRKFIHSRWQRVWEAARRSNPRIHIWYHSDGNIISIIPELIEAGVDILNPLQPECLDVDAVYRSYGDRIVFDGTIGTQSTMPFGTPTDVRARVREVVEKYGEHGGLIISPTHLLEPDVPIANVEAFVDACREYGALT